MPMPRKSKEKKKRIEKKWGNNAAHKRKNKQKAKQKKRQQGNVTTQGEGKNNNKGNLKKPMYTCTCTFLSIKKKFIPTKFSLHFEEKTFWWAKGENTWVLSFIFLPSHPTKYTPKNISFLFSLQSFPFTLFHLQTNTP